MGFKDAWNAQLERSRIECSYGVHSVNKDGTFRFLPQGKFKQDIRPVAGAVAEYEAGSDIGGRTTLTRVVAGAVLAGPVGAILGGMFKKDRSKGYVTVTFPDGAVVIIEGPLKDEPKLRTFARKVNEAAQHHSTQ